MMTKLKPTQLDARVHKLLSDCLHMALQKSPRLIMVNDQLGVNHLFGGRELYVDRPKLRRIQMQLPDDPIVISCKSSTDQNRINDLVGRTRGLDIGCFLCCMRWPERLLAAQHANRRQGTKSLGLMAIQILLGCLGQSDRLHRSRSQSMVL